MKRGDYPDGDEGLTAYRKDWQKANDKERHRKRWQDVKIKQEVLAGRPRSDKCEICGGTSKIVFDHCHITKAFRGWLCEPCNRVLGIFNDDPARFIRAAEYLSVQRDT